MVQKFFTLIFMVLMAASMPLEAKKKYGHSAPVLNCQEPLHPLDPLTCEEIDAIRILIDGQQERIDGAIYTDIILKEPAKRAVLAFEKNGGPFTREAQVILYNNSTAKTFEYIVYVCGTDVQIKCKRELCGVFPNMNLINNFQGSGQDPKYMSDADLIAAVAASPELIQALQEAGFPDPVQSLIDQDLFAVSNTFESFRSKESNLPCCPEVITKHMPKHRYFPITFSDEGVTDPYGADFFSIVHGVEGILDATTKKIVAVIKANPKKVPDVTLGEAPSYVHLGSQNPISITSTANYQVNGNVVTWDNWKFRLSWHPHAGLQLYQIQYWDQKVGDEDGKYRSVLYKASLSDAAVSYNVGTEVLFARNYLSGDAFHYPWLRRFAPICKGRDVPDTDSVQLYSMFAADTQGKPVEFKDAIAIYEQDSDLLWRTATPISFATLPDPNCVQGARGRQLVVRTIFQGVYYLWIVSWIFNQDGSINVGVDVGGRTQNIIIPKDSADDYIWGEETAPQEFSLNHTHIYNFRLDFDVDGTKNTVIEENQSTIDSRKQNPCGQAVRVTEKVLKSEKKAIRDMNLESNRQWIVINPEVTNRVGHPVGYELIPQRNGFEKSADYSTLHQQFSFLKHHLHVTRFHDDEQFASGSMPILQDKDTGLGAYVKDDECLENEDVVVWYTLNFAHVPHTEDYPTISLYRQGFSLIPHNFFDSNPGLSVFTDPTTCSCPTPPDGCVVQDQCNVDGTAQVTYPIPCDLP